MKGRKLYLFSLLFCAGVSLLAQNRTFRVAHLNLGQLSMGKKNHTTVIGNDRKLKMAQFKELFGRIDADFFGVCEYAPYFSLLPDSSENVRDLTEDVIFKNYKHSEGCKRSHKNCNRIFSRKKKLKDFRTVKYSQGKGRCFVVADVLLDKKVVKLVETHLDVPRMKEFREIQMEELLDAFKDEKYVIICGDFNIASVKEYNRFKDHGYKLANCQDFGRLITYPGSKGGACFDNIMCKGFEIQHVQVYETNLSDHYAIACDLQMKK